MCEELVDAEQALADVPNTTAELQEARRAEWQELVDRLVADVGTALRQSNSSKDQDGRSFS